MRDTKTAEQYHLRIAALNNLPTLPGIAVEMIRKWSEPDLSIRAISDLLAHDPSLSAKVLQVANSASFGLRKKISSLNHAAALLGLNALRCLTLGVTVFQSFSDKKAAWAKEMDLDEFWRHSLAVAVAAEMLSVRLGWPAPEEGFLAGLLHDIGKIGMLATVPKEYVDVLGRASAGRKSLLDYELEVLTVSHAEVGKWIADRWGFPDIFRNAIWLHHQPPQIAKLQPNQLGTLIFLADHLVRRARIGESGNRLLVHNDEWIEQCLNLKGKDLNTFTSELLTRVQSMGEHLNLSIPTVEIYLKALEDANQQLSVGGLESDLEHRKALRSLEILNTITEIHQMQIHQELEIDLLAKSVDLIRTCFELPWMLVMTYNPTAQILEGVVSSNSYGKTQTFYRIIESTESTVSTPSDKGIFDLLGETVLSGGSRVNLRNEVCRVLERGHLVAIPVEIDQTYRGECMVDTQGSYVVDAESRQLLDTTIAAAMSLQDRSHLYRKLQNEAEAAAQATRREAEAMRQIFHIERLASVGRLAAGAAHEINNPLAVISGKAQLLLMDEKEDSRAKSLKDIIGQSDRITKIITDLMGFARPTKPVVSNITVTQIVETALHMTRHRCHKSKVVHQVQIDPDIPILHVDGNQIEQVLVNLMVNAIQAMGEYGTLTVQGLYDRPDHILIQVTDTGPGIPPTDLPKIFDPFFTTKKEGEGTGLGLAICMRIIESHSGHLWVNSHLGSGTTFTIQLPIKELAADSFSKGSGEPEKTQELLICKPVRKRILLVEDEAALSDLIRDFLIHAGFEVDQAADGMEGMKCMNHRPYDCLIIDLRMPRMDGLEVLKELQESTPGFPTLVITGLATEEELDQAKSLGAGQVLRKPFQLDHLLHAVRALTHS